MKSMGKRFLVALLSVAIILTFTVAFTSTVFATGEVTGRERR